jgi:transposase
MTRASREVWAKRVERWKDSGLSAKEFAAELDVSPKSLTFWRWKLRQGETASDAPSTERSKQESIRRRESPQRFLQLVASSPASPNGTALELVIKDGLTLRVAPGFDEPTLLRLVGLLGGAR